MSRLPEKPQPLIVELDTYGLPTSLTFTSPVAGAGSHACPGPRIYSVLEVCSRWRVDDDWWRVPISRTYYKLRTSDALLEVYHDLIGGGWYLERVHD